MKTVGSVLLVFAVGVSAGCSLMEPEVPKCSDADTLDLVRRIIAENVGVAGGDSIPAEALRKVLTIDLPHATSLEENIKKYSCQATLRVPNGQGGQHSLTLDYTSQLDDQDQHLVHIGGLDAGDQIFLMGAVASAKNNVTSADVNPISEASRVDGAPADEPAMENAAEAPAAPSPEAIAEIERQREAILSGQDGGPKLEDYPVGEIYQGPVAALDLSSETARTFRTKLSEGLADGQVAFAGEYAVAGWGCGTQCYVTTLVSKRTGHVVEKGFGGEDGELIMKMEPSSRLLVAEGPEMDDQYNQIGYFAYFYVMENGELQLVKKTPLPESLEE